MFDKPLFSRRQLNIIIVVTAVAIVLLSTSGNQQALPQFEQSEQPLPPIYWHQQEEGDLRLSLNFKLPPSSRGDSTAVRMIHQQLLEQLRRTIQQPNLTLEVNRRPERLQILIRQPENQPLSSVLEPLVEALQAPVDPQQWHRFKQEQQAQRYIDQGPKKPGWERMRGWLNPEPIAQDGSLNQWLEFRQQLFSRSQLSLALMAEEIAPRLREVRSALQHLPEGAPWPKHPVPEPPAQYHQQGVLGNHQLIIGRLGRGRLDPGFTSELVAVTLLRQWADQLNIYSEWTPMAERSQLLFSVSGQQPIETEQLLGALQRQLTQTSDEALETEQEALSEQLRQQMQTPGQRFRQLDTLAFYGLPTDYLNRFVSQLDELSSPALRAEIGRLLEAEPYHRLVLYPST